MRVGWILLLLLLGIPTLACSAGPDDRAMAPPDSLANATAVAASDNTLKNCQDLAAVIRESQVATSRDLRQIKGDLARLQLKLDEPGLGQIVAGIGYIFGLFGVAAFVASRKNQGKE